MKKRFDLPEYFTVYTAEETLASLKAWLLENPITSEDVVELSAAKVAEIDGTAMQLLAALTQSGCTWCVVDASPKFEKACQVTGNTAWLQEENAQ